MSSMEPLPNLKVPFILFKDTAIALVAVTVVNRMGRETRLGINGGLHRWWPHAF